MRSPFVRLALPVSALIVVGACTNAPPEGPSVDQAAIGAAADSVTAAFFTAVGVRDTDTVASFYSEDAHLLPPNQPGADGRAAIRKAWAGFLSAPGMQLNATPATKIVSEAGDMVVDLGTYTMQWQQNGKALSDTGKYVTVFRKVGGEWKIAVDMFNSDLPPSQ